MGLSDTYKNPETSLNSWFYFNKNDSNIIVRDGFGLRFNNGHPVGLAGTLCLSAVPFFYVMPLMSRQLLKRLPWAARNHYQAFMGK